MFKIGKLVYTFTTKDNKNWGLPFALISIITLLFTLFLYNERLYGDVAFYLFKLLNEEKFNIEHFRFISVVTQILPLILIKLNSSVENVILFYSINEWLWYIGCFLVLYKYYHSPSSGIGMLIMIVVGTRLNWFNHVSELIIASPLVFFVFLEWYKGIVKVNLWFYIRNSILLTTLVLAHPLFSFILICLIILFFLYNYKELQTKKYHIILSIISIIIIVINYFIMDSYDSACSTLTIHDNILKTLHIRLLFHFIEFLPGFTLVLILCLFNLIKESKILLASIFSGSLLFYSLIVVFKYGHTYTPIAEPFERYLFPLILLVFVFWFVILKRSWNYLILFVLFYHFYINYNYASHVKQRYFQFHSAILNSQQWNEGKIYIRAENYYPIALGQDYLMSSESLLLSSSGSNSTQQIWLEYAIDNSLTNSLQEGDFIFWPGFAKPMTNLNQKYFQFPKGKPKCANTDSIQSNMSDTFFENITLQAIPPHILPKNKETLIPVKIINSNSIPIFSGNKIEERYLTYKWIKNGVIIVQNGIRTPMMMDVYRINTQLIKIKTPPKAGNYILQLDIVYEGIKWADIKSNIPFIID